MASDPENMRISADGGFRGPDALTDAVLRVRAEHPEERRHFGKIDEKGVRKLVRMAYYTSQITNEGRHPRLTLFVPESDSTPNVLIELKAECNAVSLRRLGPTLANRGVYLLLSSEDEHLWVRGYVSSSGLLGELRMGDPASPVLTPPRGLQVEIVGPGDLRVAEHWVHRLHAGTLRQEISFFYEDWYQSWLNHAAQDRFGWSPGELPATGNWPVIPTRALDAVCLKLLREAADLRHGASFVFLPTSPPPSIRQIYPVEQCDLGGMLVELCEPALCETTGGLDKEIIRRRLTSRQRLLSAIEAVAYLSATDGCVVFDPGLRLTSFGSMIDVQRGGRPDVVCYVGDTSRHLSDFDYRSFGARRQSAIQLCAMCPGALVFVISQDGELRAFVGHEDSVRFYDHLAYW